MDGDGHALWSFILFHSKSAQYYAEVYHRDNLVGGHVIKLGPGNEDAAEEALAAWPGGLQIGGGITVDNAQHWLDKGASKVDILGTLLPSLNPQ